MERIEFMSPACDWRSEDEYPSVRECQLWVRLVEDDHVAGGSCLDPLGITVYGMLCVWDVVALVIPAMISCRSHIAGVVVHHACQ